MKAGIITFHRSINFGAILQAYALKTTIETMGIQCSVIDYKTQHIGKNLKTARLISKIKSSANPYKMLLVLIYGYNIRKKKAAFLQFAKEHLNLTREVSKKDIEELNSEIDIFITGSDQVWNDECAGFDKSYFLAFVKDTVKKNSYSASFGFDKIPENHLAEYKNLLSNFNNISVREQKGSEIIFDLLERKVPVTLDPTLLLEKDQWLEIAKKPCDLKDYILVYEMAHSDSLITFIANLQKTTGLKVVFISNKFEKKIKTAIHISGIGPKEFVGLFNNARYVVTNSFHGICFSIIFKKDLFIELLPHPSKVNSRITNILELLDLRSRLISTISQENMLHSINYSIVYEKLEHAKELSLSYLRKTVNR